MIYIKRPRIFLIGLPVLILMFGLNHLEYHMRHHSLSSLAAKPFVRQGDSTIAGHNTIAVDENVLRTGSGGRFLFFSTLGNWLYDPQAQTPCPESIKALSGKEATLIGFMYPLETSEKIRTFCLLRTTQTCCYGPKPQYNQYLFVEMKNPVTFERFAPVLLKGTFVVDPQPDQGYIYRMEGKSLSLAEKDEPDPDPFTMARDLKHPLFDFGPLEQFGKNRSQGIPKELAQYDGKPVVLSGFVVGRSPDSPPRLLVSRTWWDGVSSGSPPTPFNSVMVFPRDMLQVPPVWKQKGVFTGIAKVNTSPEEWKKSGIICLRDAVKSGVGNRKGQGPYLPVPMEAAIAFIVLACTLGYRKC